MMNDPMSGRYRDSSLPSRSTVLGFARPPRLFKDVSPLALRDEPLSD